ncbi:unnamed protein product, partial [Schistosoma turkestanicum]
FLQEVGYADAVLSVREARVRQLLLSAAGWPNEPDSSLTATDPKNKHYLWESDKLKSKLNDNAKFLSTNNRSTSLRFKCVITGSTLVSRTTSAICSNCDRIHGQLLYFLTHNSSVI